MTVVIAGRSLYNPMTVLFHTAIIKSQSSSPLKIRQWKTTLPPELCVLQSMVAPMPATAVMKSPTYINYNKHINAQCSSYVGKRAGCKRNWAQSSARTTKIRAQFSAQTTQNWAQFRVQSIKTWAQICKHKHFYIGCLKTQQELHFVNGGKKKNYSCFFVKFIF